ncbi:hypothetical protein OQA88_7527 [Cercophora sp. LCS_1]
MSDEPLPAASQQPSSQPQPQSQQDNTQNQQQPDSPPLPPVPIPTSPGPRATRLNQVFSTTLRKTLDKINRDNFSSCFPTVASKAPGTLEAVQRQMVDKLKRLCENEFESILINRGVVGKLNELEVLLSEAQGRREGASSEEVPIPPHTMAASEVLDAHLAPHLVAQRGQLNAKLQTVQGENARLFEEIQAQRREMEVLLSLVEKTLSDMDGASGLLGEVVEELAHETREAEVEMSGI